MNSFRRLRTSLMFFCLTSSVSAQTTEARTTVEQRLQAVSNQINKTLPKTLDEHTRQDTTLSGPGKRWTNFYTITKVLPASLTGDALKKIIQPSIVAGYCTDPSMTYFRDNDVTVTYSYRNVSGAFLTRFDVSLRDCR